MSARNKFTLFKVSQADSGGGDKKTKQQAAKSQLNTESLDDAIEDFLGTCQQYNDKMQGKQLAAKKDIILDKNTTTKPIPSNTCDILPNNQNSNFKYQQNITVNNNNNNNNFDLNESIERLQRKQTDLQSQLDEVLQIAEDLTSKQRRKYKSMLEEETTTTSASKFDDEDDELIEFQQIENELRISELNRQLSNIQEELRIRLYKRLTSNTGNGGHQHNGGSKHIARCNSQEDEISPSSSSCSDGPQNTSSSSIVAEIHHANQMRVVTPSSGSSSGPTNKLIDEHDGIAASRDTPSFRHFKQNFSSSVDTTNSTNSSSGNTTVLERNLQEDSRANNTKDIPATSSELDNLMESLISEYESLTLESKKEAQRNDVPKMVNHEQNNLDSMTTSCRDNLAASCSDYQTPKSNGTANSNNVYCNPTLACPGSGLPRSNVANSDLERIEEDGEEEDDQHYYNDSNRMRSIYEEKFSSIAQQTGYLKTGTTPDTITQPPTQDKNLYSSSQQRHYEGISQVSSEALANRNGAHTPPPQLLSLTPTQATNGHNRKFSLSNVNTTKRTPASKTKPASNRPLTLYLPKPDEEIDLVEHIQTLGHDLSIITDDLKIDATSAHGYLWKCCSNNSKKWLKRYFHFSRSSKTLSYFDTEAQLVKKNAKAKINIPFEEISDVYVDHRLSGLGKDDRRRSSSASSRKFVFVLSTINRKYYLATNRAETMRTWIDILFTAAKSNDFFQQFDDDLDDNDLDINGTQQTIELNSEDGNITLQSEDKVF